MTTIATPPPSADVVTAGWYGIAVSASGAATIDPSWVN